MVEGYERIGKSVIVVRERTYYMALKKSTNFQDNEFTAVKRDAECFKLDM